jgi:hypothetical protein
VLRRGAFGNAGTYRLDAEYPGRMTLEGRKLTSQSICVTVLEVPPGELAGGRLEFRVVPGLAPGMTPSGFSGLCDDRGLKWA